MEFFDTHSHYNDKAFEQDLDIVLKKVYNTGVTKLVCIGYNLESSRRAVELANKFDYIYATCGISPNDIDENSERELEEIYELAQNNKKVVAIGEIGLDYYWVKDNIEKQKEIFQYQLDLASKYNKPIVVHSREAIQDTYDILKKYNLKGSIHCFSSSLEMARQFIKLGYKIGIGGTLTFKNSKKLEHSI